MIEGAAGAWIINLVIIPVMILLALVLPPLSIPQRVLAFGYTSVSPANGGAVSANGAQFSIPPNSIKNSVGIRLSYKPRDQFLKDALAKSLPAKLDVKSPLYQPGVQGEVPAQAILSVPIPEASEPLITITVFGYDGKKWAKLPFQIFTDDQRIEAYISQYVPQAVIVAQTQAQPPTIGADLSDKSALPAQAASIVAEVTPLGYYISEGAGIAGNVPPLPEASAASNLQALPNISNFIGDRLRPDISEDVVGYADSRKAHVRAIVDLAVEQLYPGVNIDYQGMGSDYRADYTTFIRELAEALHAKNKILSVTLALPVQRSSEVWDTGAFDWAGIGQAADMVRIPLPADRAMYAGAPAPVTVYMQWAVGQIDQFKLQLTFSVLGRDEFENSYAPVGFANAVKLMGPIQVPATVAPDSKTTLDLPRLRESGGVKSDANTGLYTFTYKDAKNVSHTVVVENAESLAKKLGLALQYNLRGVVLRDLNADALDARAWDVLKQYRDLQSANLKGNLAIIWRVDGQSVAKTSVSDPKHQWTAPRTTGSAKIEALLSFDAGQTATGVVESKAVSVARSGGTTSTGDTTSAPRPTTAPAAPKAAAASSNFRGKNLFGYGIQVQGGDPSGEAARIKELGFGWVKIQLPWKDGESGKGNYTLGSYDNFVNSMGSSGIKVLLSIVKAPEWSRRQNANPGEGPPDNMQDAADFMGHVAGRYCGKGVEAIEVWNEANLDVEWHDKRGLSAALYMDMLKKSFAAIKAACPNVVVVAQASTPNGLNSATAIDDVTFLQQMYQSGLRDFSDAIGAHPSGFRSPPEAQCAPGGPSYADHRSFCFRSTMDAYRAVMVQNGDANKQIWATEFGWPVGTGGGAHPAGQFNSAEVAGDYYVRAYQWAKAQGWVGVMFAWQLDFSGGEVGAFRIQGAPAFGKLAAMPK